MWQVQEAKAKFSEFLDKAIREGPQVVSRRGVAAAVLVPIEEWETSAKARAAHSEGSAVGRRAPI